MAFAGGVPAQEDVVAGIQMSRASITRVATSDVPTNTWTCAGFAATRSGAFSVFDNDGTRSQQAAIAIDDPARTTAAPAFGSELICFGSAELNSTVDHIIIPYFTTVPGDPDHGVPGFNMVITIREPDDMANFDRQVNAQIIVPDLPGGGGVFLTINLGSSHAFEIGDTDGVNFYAGSADLLRRDLYEDGRAPFSWGVSFQQRQAQKGQAGVLMCMGGNDGGRHQDGDDWIPLTSAHTNSHLFRWLPTRASRLTGSQPAGASSNIEFRGPIPCDPFMDLNGDGAFDVGDFFNFFQRFDVAGG